MAEENSTPQYDDLELSMSGGPGYDPINESITKPPATKVNMGLPEGFSYKGLEGLQGVVDPRLLPPPTAAGQVKQQISSLLQSPGADATVDPINPISSQGIKNFLVNTQAQGLDVMNDPFKGSKRVMGDFQDAQNMNQFYDRYAGHSDFDKLGFSPFRDNETLFNENTSFWKEMGRASGEWGSLAWTGLKDAAGFGNITDLEAAEEMERSMAIGNSTVGGVSGFTTNLYLNSAYTVGIMAELVAEELAMVGAEIGLGALTVGSGGLASGATAPAMGGIALRMGIKAEQAWSKLSKAYKASSKMMKVFDNMKDVNNARKFFNKTAKGALDLINPLDNTIDFIKGVDKMDDVNNWVKTYRGFGSFYKDVRNVRLAYGEGSLEGGMVRNQMTRDLISNFKQENGRMPNEEEAAKIYAAAETAGKNTAFLNMPLILFSNKLTFDGLVRGRFSNLSKDLIEVAGKKAIFNPKKGIKEAFQLQPKNWFKAKWNYLKTPTTWLKEGALYTKANLAEGLQEIGQEVVSAAESDFQMAKYKGDPLRGGYYSFLGEALTDQISMHGLETFASGFLMGGMISPVSNAVASATQGKESVNNIYKRVFKNEEWSKIRDERDAQAAELVNKLNTFYADPRNYLNKDLENLQAQAEAQKGAQVASENGDRKLYEDVMDASMIDHVQTAISSGKFDTFIQRMEEMKALSPEEAVEFMQGQSHEQYLKSLDASIRKAKDIQKRHDYFASKRKNPFDPNKHKREVNGKPNPAYIKEYQAFTGWNNAVQEAVFNQNTFDRALERQKEILESAQENSGLSSASYSEFNVLFDFKNIQNEIDLLKTEVEGLDEKSKDKTVIESRAQRKKKLAALTEYADAIQDMMSNPGENESIPEAQYKRMEKAYKGYVDYLAEKNGDYPNTDQKDKSLDLLMNWYQLEGRKKPAMDAVNVLLDPKGFNKAFERYKEVEELKMLSKKAEIAESLKQYRKKQETNQMLNALADEGMFFDVDELIKLEQEGLAPSKFYYTNDEGNNDQVVRNTDDYMKAIDIISKYNAVTHGIDITNSKELHAYTGMSRKKDDTDKRTYEDLATQFGFDPKNPTTKVPLRQVLKSIIESKHSNPADIALAEKLLENASDKETVTFSRREPQPGMYSEVTQTVVDARYSSHNYREGAEGHPIEHIILKEEVGRRIYEKVAEDPKFKEQLDTLREEALEAFKKLSDQEKTVYFSGPFNLIDAQEFAKAAMTNERFQTFLATVSSAMPTKTVWQQFVDAVLDIFEKGFGTRPSGTVLNAVMDVVTAKIDINPIDTAASPVTKPASTTTTTTPTTPVGKYKGKDVIPESVKKLQNPAKLSPIVSVAMQQALRDLGYSETEISTMHKAGQVAEVQRIIDNVITRDDMIATAEAKTANPERAKAAIDLRFDISELIKSAADAVGTKDAYKTWLEVDEQLVGLILEDDQLVEESGWEIDQIRQQMLEIKQEIASKDVTFEELETGEYVVLQKGETIAEVIDLKEGLAVLQYLNGTKKVFEVKSEDVSKIIKYRYEPLMTQEEKPAPTPTPEQKENITASMEVTTTPSDQVKALVEGAKTKDAKDLKDNLLDSIC